MGRGRIGRDIFKDTSRKPISRTRQPIGAPPVDFTVVPESLAAEDRERGNEVRVLNENAARILMILADKGYVGLDGDKFMDEEWVHFGPDSDPNYNLNWNWDDVESALNKLPLVELLTDQDGLTEKQLEAQQIIAEARGYLRDLVRRRKLKETFGELPSEFTTLPVGEVMDRNQLERHHRVVNVSENVASVPAEELAGVYIEIQSIYADRESAKMYHRFSKDELRSLRDSDEDNVIFVEPGVSHGGILLNSLDQYTGDFGSISAPQVIMYAESNGKIAVINDSLYGEVSVVLENREIKENVSEIEQQALRWEYAPQDSVLLYRSPDVSRETVERMEYAMGSIKGGNEYIPRHLKTFEEWMALDGSVEQVDREDIRRAIALLDGHRLHSTEMAGEEQANANLAEMVHGFEKALNPKMTLARVSDSYKERWVGFLDRGEAGIEELRKMQAKYRNFKQEIERHDDLRTVIFQPEEITRDNDIMLEMIGIVRSIREDGISPESLGQINEAYHRWLRDALEIIGDLLKKDSNVDF